MNEDLVEEANLTAANFPAEENEFEWASLETAPSTFVKAPRVAASRSQ